MKICCVGDSLTEGDYGIPGKRGIKNVHEKNYPCFLAEMTGAEVLNFGISGIRSDNYLGEYERYGWNVAGADVILMMLGTNRCISDKEELPGNECYREIIRRLQKEAPTAKLYLITPPHVTENPAYSNCGYAAHVKDAVPFVRNVAKEFGLPLIDAALFPDFCAENEALYQGNDGLHFIEAGYRRFAELIAEAIK